MYDTVSYLKYIQVWDYPETNHYWCLVGVALLLGLEGVLFICVYVLVGTSISMKKVRNEIHI